MSKETHPLTVHLKSTGETITAFAERVGMSRMQLYRIINGEGTTTDTVQMLSAATGGKVSPSAFFPEPKKKIRSTSEEKAEVA